MREAFRCRNAQRPRRNHQRQKEVGTKRCVNGSGFIVARQVLMQAGGNLLDGFALILLLCQAETGHLASIRLRHEFPI